MNGTVLRAPIAALLVCAWGVASASPGEAGDGEERPWEFSASLYAFLLPDATDYLNPNLTADHERGLHLEARYNYEALRTGSAWVGYTFAWGEDLALEVTPMAGVVFGEVDGFAPGWLVSLAWRKLSLSSQGEYLFDAAGSEGNFLYVWSELSWSPVDWFRTGLALQRTRAHESELDVQPGILAAFTWREIELAGYVFDLGWTDPTVVLALVATF